MKPTEDPSGSTYLALLAASRLSAAIQGKGCSVQEEHLTNFYRFQQKEKRRSGKHRLSDACMQGPFPLLLLLWLAAVVCSALAVGPASTLGRSRSKET